MDEILLENIKIVGKIDLDAMNQRTRPKKKSRRKLEKERKERIHKQKAVDTTEMRPAEKPLEDSIF